MHSVQRAHENTTDYNRGIPSKPYDIPLRALIAKDIKGLMMAGRCISGDFVAHSSYRVTGVALNINPPSDALISFLVLNLILNGLMKLIRQDLPLPPPLLPPG